MLSVHTHSIRASTKQFFFLGRSSGRGSVGPVPSGFGRRAQTHRAGVATSRVSSLHRSISPRLRRFRFAARSPSRPVGPRVCFLPDVLVLDLCFFLDRRSHGVFHGRVLEGEAAVQEFLGGRLGSTEQDLLSHFPKEKRDGKSREGQYRRSPQDASHGGGKVGVGGRFRGAHVDGSLQRGGFQDVDHRAGHVPVRDKGEVLLAAADDAAASQEEDRVELGQGPAPGGEDDAVAELHDAVAGGPGGLRLGLPGPGHVGEKAGGRRDVGGFGGGGGRVGADKVRPVDTDAAGHQKVALLVSRGGHGPCQRRGGDRSGIEDLSLLRVGPRADSERGEESLSRRDVFPAQVDEGVEAPEDGPVDDGSAAALARGIPGDRPGGRKGLVGEGLLADGFGLRSSLEGNETNGFPVDRSDGFEFVSEGGSDEPAGTGDADRVVFGLVVGASRHAGEGSGKIFQEGGPQAGAGGVASGSNGRGGREGGDGTGRGCLERGVSEGRHRAQEQHCGSTTATTDRVGRRIETKRKERGDRKKKRLSCRIVRSRLDSTVQ
mmetsp:Transcript_7336/g.17725  ORF Transcript_7336/g.17725 Transcript_7336/m.17725 type:complete len:546 (+) Transcript_7336:64-1701(+)